MWIKWHDFINQCFNNEAYNNDLIVICCTFCVISINRVNGWLTHPLAHSLTHSLIQTHSYTPSQGPSSMSCRAAPPLGERSLFCNRSHPVQFDGSFSLYSIVATPNGDSSALCQRLYRKTSVERLSAWNRSSIFLLACRLYHPLKANR